MTCSTWSCPGCRCGDFLLIRIYACSLRGHVAGGCVLFVSAAAVAEA